MSNKELLPCPFCGGKAIIKESKFGLNVIFCESCEARITALYLTDVSKAWNKRVDVAKTDECCKKSCKDENATCKKNLQLTRSDIEKMVKPIEWEDYNGEYNNIYTCSKYMGDLYFEIKSANRKTYWVGVCGMCNWLDSSVSECKQQAQLMLVDIICSALGVEEFITKQ